MAAAFLIPDWPCPAGVKALVTTRQGGVSAGGYASLNLASHVGDEPLSVAENRRRLLRAARLPRQPLWLTQVHGIAVAALNPNSDGEFLADACWTSSPAVPCAVLTADCLPVLFASKDGHHVAAAHAGWRGLVAGVLEAAVQAIPIPADQLLAWLGPAIGPDVFEVGVEVRAAFVEADAGAGAHFVAHRDRYLADLFGLARRRLRQAGVTAIYGGGHCTVADAERFFSYRRDTPLHRVSGRFASVIWRE